jgi:hypothetical protein
MQMTLRAWQQTHKDPKTFIVQASTQDGSDGWTPFPIGMGWQYATHYGDGQGCHKWQIGSHQTLVQCAISDGTDGRRRPYGLNRRMILFNLSKNRISNRQVSGPQYFNELPSYKFVISPEGNGIDCHRHYEALMAGCIPIMEDNPLIKEKYKGLPILYTKDYSEITSQYLEQRYKEMIEQTYDFSRLFLSSYNLEDQIKIKTNGNYWVKRFCYKLWY